MYLVWSFGILSANIEINRTVFIYIRKSSNKHFLFTFAADTLQSANDANKMYNRCANDLRAKIGYVYVWKA